MLNTQSSIEELLRSIRSLELVKMVALQKGLVDPKPLFYSINRYDAQPSSRIRLGAGQTEKDRWLERCLGHVNFRNKCYLYIDHLAAGWHWSEVEAVDPKEWILNLLLRDDVGDFMVLSHDQANFLGLVEDEAEYLAFLSETVNGSLTPLFL
jgi:hypothetical protein